MRAQRSPADKSEDEYGHHNRRDDQGGRYLLLQVFSPFLQVERTADESNSRRLAHYERCLQKQMPITAVQTGLEALDQEVRSLRADALKRLPHRR